MQQLKWRLIDAGSDDLGKKIVNGVSAWTNYDGGSVLEVISIDRMWEVVLMNLDYRRVLKRFPLSEFSDAISYAESIYYLTNEEDNEKGKKH